MLLPNRIIKDLQQKKIDYKEFEIPEANTLDQLINAAGLARDSVARGVLLKDELGIMLAILPSDCIIDFSCISKKLKRDFKIADSEMLTEIFTDCEKGTVPPIPDAYCIDSICDKSLLEQKFIYIEPGMQGKLLCIGKKSWKRLLKTSKYIGFSAKVNGMNAVSAAEQISPKDTNNMANCIDQEGNMFDKYMPSSDVRKRLDQLYSLPPMPQVALRILQIKDDPESTVDDLASCVELDPSLAAQVVRYARSPFFGYRGDINNIRDAIHKVLGFSMVTNISIGLASGKSFKNPADGPLGLNEFWRQATYTSALVQEFAKVLPKDKRPNPGLAYLAALVHNFGYLLLGHLFKPEFFLLNKLVSANPDVPITDLEKQVLGMGDAQYVISLGHAKLGAWLMHSWDMPDEVVITIGEHHNPEYDGPHCIFPALVLIADRLIRSKGFGDGDAEEIPQIVLDRLGLTLDKVNEVFEKVMNGSDSLDNIANQLAT